MYERNKLLEAQYFLNQMKSNTNNFEVFCYNLSAFLSASRSTLYFMRREVKGTENQRWYDDKMRESEIFRFFTQKRDLTVHEKPVQPNVNISTQHRICVRATEVVVALKRVDSNGEVIEKYSSSKNLLPNTTNLKQEPKEGKVELTYVFDYDGSEESVINICERYFQDLERYVEEGIRLGYISG